MLIAKFGFSIYNCGKVTALFLLLPLLFLLVSCSEHYYVTFLAPNCQSIGNFILMNCLHITRTSPGNSCRCHAPTAVSARVRHTISLTANCISLYHICLDWDNRRGLCLSLYFVLRAATFNIQCFSLSLTQFLLRSADKDTQTDRQNSPTDGWRWYFVLFFWRIFCNFQFAILPRCECK